MELQECNDIHAIIDSPKFPEEVGEDQPIVFALQHGLSLSDQGMGTYWGEEDTFTFIDITKLELILGPIIQLSTIYIFKDMSSISNIIFKNKRLIDILFNAPNHIMKIFGQDVILFLEIDRDPEEGCDRLFIIIASNLPIGNSLDLLEKLEEDWWLSVDYEIKQILGIDIRSIL